MPRSWILTFTLMALLLIPTELVIANLARNRLPDQIPVTRGIVSGDFTNPDDVDRFVIETIRQSGIPGVELALVHNNQILYTAGYGRNADGTATTPDTPMAVASLSKSFTAAAVMQLVEEGKIILDAPFLRYLSDFQPADPRMRKITVRHLLSHRSGLTSESLPETVATGRAPLHQSLRERVDWLQGAILNSEPGTQTVYDNFNYELLADLVEKVSGESFEEYLPERIFRPLAMNSSRTMVTTRDTAYLPAGHMLLFGIPFRWEMPPDLVIGAGGVVSTANDLAHWLAMQVSGGLTVDGNRLFSEQTISLMHTEAAPGAEYGFGWRQATLPEGTPYVHHSGRLVTFAAHEALFPSSGMAYAFICNGMHPLPAGGAALLNGLNAIVNGKEPDPGGSGSKVIDHMIAVLIAFIVAMGVVFTLSARHWAERLSGIRLWRLVLRCLPFAILAAGAAVPLMLAAPWQVLWDIWPTFAVLILMAELSAAAIVTARTVAIVQERRARIARRVAARP